MTVLLGYIDQCVASMNILLVTSDCAGIVINALTYYISLINTTFWISTPVQYYTNTNNIEMVVIFISSTPSNNTTCHFATPDIIANYHVTMAISSIVFEL